MKDYGYKIGPDGAHRAGVEKYQEAAAKEGKPWDGKSMSLEEATQILKSTVFRAKEILVGQKN